MANLNFEIDTEKCIHCGLCVKDCIAGIIEFDENKTPRLKPDAEKRCIKCQHCLAVCPTGALSILDKNPENSDKVDHDQNPEKVLNLIKSRRSFRQYKPENLPKETLEKLKNMLNWVPTGCNAHSLHFSIIDDVEVMDEFRNYVNSELLKSLSKTPVRGIMNRFSRYKDAFLHGEDVIFRGAPHMIVVSVPITAPCADIDPTIALSYFELYAQSLGVATLWCGFAKACLLFYPELCEKLEIPENHKAAYVMLFGPSDLKYTRAVQPESVGISTVKKGAIQKLGFKAKIKRYLWNFSR